MGQCIVGMVSNNCGVLLSAVYLDFNLFDSSGVQLGSVTAAVDNLEPHGKARFTAVIPGKPKIKEFKLVRAYRFVK